MLTIPWFRKPKPRFPSVGEFGFVELRGGESRVVVVPALGGKITSMLVGGRQWLWTSDVIPYATGVEGASYAETADSGGYDECFPTVEACRVPGWVKAFGGVELPDHGELWSQTPALEIETTSGGQCAVTTWQGSRMPYRVTRIIRAAPDGAVVMEYHATNDGGERIPFIWSAHPLLPMTPESRLVLPDGAPMRVYAAHRITLGDHKSMHQWPYVRAAGKVFDFGAPYNVAREFACKLFVDMPGAEGRAAIREGSHELEVTFETAQVGQFGLWLNKHGWSPFKRGAPYLNLAFEPAIGAPDTLSDALGDWKRAHWLEPGEVRSWRLTWRGRVLQEDLIAGT